MHFSTWFSMEYFGPLILVLWFWSSNPARTFRAGLLSLDRSVLKPVYIFSLTMREEKDSLVVRLEFVIFWVWKHKAFFYCRPWCIILHYDFESYFENISSDSWSDAKSTAC